MDVKTHGRKVTVIHYEEFLKSSLKQMVTPLMPTIG
jgi:hypothetical protein